MGLIKKVLMGGAIGAGLNKWAADRDWRKKKMHEARDWAGDPVYEKPFPLDEVGIHQMVHQMNQWEATGRVKSWDQAFRGGIMGAIAGAALHAGSRGRRIPAREPPIPRTPRIPGENVMPHPYADWHPAAAGMGIPGARTAPAA